MIDAALDALNAVCPYYTMYPLRFPLQVLKRHGKPGQWVIDPFCGRGTTNFAARLLGMPTVGIDSSPVAAALASAKLVHASPGRVVASARTILSVVDRHADIPNGPFWKLAFHEKTLAQLCSLRTALLDDCASASRVLLRAIILGALHGPRRKLTQSHFSNQAPRTFAPKPNYAVKFWTKRNMQPEAVDVLEIIKTRAERYLAVPALIVDGMVRRADSRRIETFDGVPKVRWIVTSPPYYGMRTYLPDQWLRNWFLGGADYVEYRQPQSQLEHTGADCFSAEMCRVWKNLATCSTPKTQLIIRFGGLHDRAAEPMEVLQNSLRHSGWGIQTAKRVPDAAAGRRQVRQFRAKPKKSIAEYDVYCRPV